MTRLSRQSLFFCHAAQLLTLAGRPVPRRGKDLAELGIISDGAVLTQGDVIVAVGRTRGLESEARRLKARRIDCRGRVVMPGFVDSHTHLVFAGSRVRDFEQRISGRSYAAISRAGGGIEYSARLLRQASAPELEAQANRFLEQFAAHGTTTVEVKTGYGLDVSNELKSLRVIEQLRRRSRLEIVPTLLAAHAVPRAYRGRARDYVDLVTKRLIPLAAKHGLAEFVDCFCDRVAFSVEDCRRVFEAGRRVGLVPRLHAEQLSRMGSLGMAIDLDAASADHLDYASAAGIRALARSDVVATLVPGANFHLGLRRYPPARRLIDAGAIVALSTDFNPGTSPTLNMQFILALACSAMRMTPAEAVAAATINAAYSLRRANRLGSLEAGKQADLAVMDVDDYRKIPYFFATNHCVMTVKRGRIIYPHSRHSRL
ncbi:MAG TPA: imidazolonepropionase [Terriglobia bacterium]|nr:imidazolonepropionase [Terriglobia bacterium]